MKKAIASLLVLFLGASMVMAEVPVPGAALQQTAAAGLESLGNVAVAEPPALGTDPFVEVEGVVLTESDVFNIRGGQLPDMYGSVIYGSGAPTTVMNSNWVPTQSQKKESANEIKKAVTLAMDMGATVVGLYSIGNPVPKAIQYAVGTYSVGRAIQQCSSW
ncbi:MAG: hypothetical protein N2Z76_06645 [Treponemataceae bacterium]|nr:hypothetical protein [Treponemataceae bacterium]